MHSIGNALLFSRPALLFIAALAQIYLFIQVRRALRASAYSARFQSRAAWGIGAGMTFLWAFHTYVVMVRLPWVEPPFMARAGLLYPAVVWNFGSILSALVLAGLRGGGWLGRVFRKVRSRAVEAAPAAKVAPIDIARRRFLRAGAGGLAAAPFAVVAYGAGPAVRDYEITRLSLPFGRALRVVQLSDIHAGLYMTRDDMKVYVDLVNSLQPDLFVLTGDFISNSMDFLYGCAEEMARVRARYGTFAVLGNHERWYGQPDEIDTVFRAQQISLLNNTHQVIQTDGGPFAVAGIDDLYMGQPDLDAALRGLPSSIPSLLLSHRPEIFPEAARRGVPVTLAGHWHGGQIKVSLPGIDVSLAHVLSPYPEGRYQIGASHLYVTRGIGTAWAPSRFNAPPEVVVLTLTLT